MKAFFVLKLLAVAFIVFTDKCSSFVVVKPCPVKHQAGPPLRANKDDSSSTKTKNDNDEYPAWKKIARIMVTGSMDGVHMLGKPQFDWTTGKPEAKRKSFNWNTNASNEASNKRQQRKTN